MEKDRTLRLEILLHSLKVDIPQSPRDQASKEPRTVPRQVRVLTQEPEHRLRARPQDRHGHVEQAQDEKPALQEDARIVLVRAAREGRRRQRIQRRRAAQRDQPRGAHGEHVREGGRGQIVRRGPPHDQHGDGLKAVLQHVGQDDGDRALQEQQELVQHEPSFRPAAIFEMIEVAISMAVSAFAIRGLGEEACVFVRRVGIFQKRSVVDVDLVAARSGDITTHLGRLRCKQEGDNLESQEIIDSFLCSVEAECITDKSKKGQDQWLILQESSRESCRQTSRQCRETEANPLLFRQLLSGQ